MAIEPMNVDDVLAQAQKAGFSNDAENQAGLPPQLQRLHRAALRSFLDRNAAPTRQWFREEASRLLLDPDEALARLAEVDLVHVGPEGLSVAYPFSGAPTRHRVGLARSRGVWAMCAIDALGVLGMIGEDGVVTSSDPDSNAPIRVERHQGEWIWEPESTVVAIALPKSSGTSAELLCPQIDFHTDLECAESYLNTDTGSVGHVLDQVTAVELVARRRNTGGVSPALDAPGCVEDARRTSPGAGNRLAHVGRLHPRSRLRLHRQEPDRPLIRHGDRPRYGNS